MPSFHLANAYENITPIGCRRNAPCHISYETINPIELRNVLDSIQVNGIIKDFTIDHVSVTGLNASHYGKYLGELNFILNKYYWINDSMTNCFFHFTKNSNP